MDSTFSQIESELGVKATAKTVSGWHIAGATICDGEVVLDNPLREEELVAKALAVCEEALGATYPPMDSAGTADWETRLQAAELILSARTGCDGDCEGCE